MLQIKETLYTEFLPVLSRKREALYGDGDSCKIIQSYKQHEIKGASKISIRKRQTEVLGK
jgi:hypothetical protein